MFLTISLRTLDVNWTSETSSECLMYVSFVTCVQRSYVRATEFALSHSTELYNKDKIHEKSSKSWRGPTYLHGFRSSRSQMFFKIGVLKNFHKCHRKTPVLEYLFNKVTGPYRSATLLKRDPKAGVLLWHLQNL